MQLSEKKQRLPRKVKKKLIKSVELAYNKELKDQANRIKWFGGSKEYTKDIININTGKAICKQLT